MPLPLLPLFVVALGGTAVVAQRRRAQAQTQASPSGLHGVMTPERQAIYDQAMNLVEDPVKLQQLAQVYDAEGLPQVADMLRKRANLRNLPEATKQQREAIALEALKSTNKQAIEQVARAFHQEGCSTIAGELYRRAASL